MLGMMMPFPLTLTPVLERAEKLFGAVAVISRRPDKSVLRSNYAEVCRRARALAAALDDAGLHSGDRVGSLMWNHSWHLEAYLGVTASGCVLHTINPRLHPDEIAYIVRHAGDRMLLVDDVLLPVWEKVRDRVDVDCVLVAPTSGAGVPDGYLNYDDVLASDASGYRFPALDEDQAAVMCYTSGTTGQPKGVVYSHRALVLHSFAVALPDCFCLAQRDRVLPVVPMFHANGWGIPAAAAMLGATLVLPGANLEPAGLLDLLAAERITRAAGVPTVWLGILEMLDEYPQRWQLPPDFCAVVGGAAMPESMAHRFEQHGIDARQAWGMTELTPVGTVSVLRTHMTEWPEDQRLAMRAKQGTPLPFVEIRAVHGSTEVPWDGSTAGELQVRGPWVAAGYFGNEQVQSWTDDGWFSTGDVVTLDRDGYVKLVDRSKDMIKSGGEWISSVELENALMKHPAVREAAVIGVPHPRWQERPLAVVALRSGQQATAPELRAHLAAMFSRWQLPDAIIFLPEIPRTSVGKFQKSRLREMFAGWQWSLAAGGGEAA